MQHITSVSFGEYKGFINSKYNFPSFLRQISDCNSLLEKPECQILLNSRNKIGAIKIKLNGENYKEILIKKFSFSGLNKLKTFFLPSKTIKSWESANKLIDLNIPTPFPIAFFEKRRKGFTKDGFFITEKLNHVQEIRYIFMNYKSIYIEKLLSSLADFLKHCHNKGVLHCDLSDGNVLVSKKNDNFNFYLVDVNRIKFRKKIGILKRIRNLIRLGVPPSHQKFFLMEYIGKDDLPIFYWIWYKFNKFLYWEKIQIKKKLGLKKLAKLLRIQ
ncbi:lipopolysaccharide kinase InaA family protein [Candidatus Aminicenantes bacterium AC-335-A11]|jgi:serine/threonine protein kinase|nr:lipopolysaccharide kinase InaA family protein [SCandidatus Aminicenantes bacterium Aminicenantia_JdfR_composite]MCP2617925.1 lipopolysaccharide kinase InaA family protein [Candidatus Aminicenantes bacterium AC-335-A11]